MTLRTPPNPVCQNAVPILALDGFKRVIIFFKYQEFMPGPSDAMFTLVTDIRRNSHSQWLVQTFLVINPAI